MSELLRPAAEAAALLTEALGVGLIALLAIHALSIAAVEIVRRHDADHVMHAARQRLGRGILLGLELLVAADIIHTVAVELTFTSVGVLALVVAIRTFLSFTLEVELTGSWPWQKSGKKPDRTPA